MLNILLSLYCHDYIKRTEFFMFTNLYHVASFNPAVEKEDMTVGREELAQKLVKSGRFRIDAGEKINFARLYIPELTVSMMVGHRELYDKNLLSGTKSRIRKELQGTYQGARLEEKLKQHIKLLKEELEKYLKVTLEEEMKLARLVVQSTHPVVMMMILLEKVEIFLSHSHNIGDVLDIVTWNTAGSNSGMQSTNGVDAAIFISCGGNPLTENEDKSAEYGDGWPARARILIIGGQELGHYSDIMRDEYGRQISRYSANFSATQAKEDVRIGRINDIKRGIYVLETLKEIGLENVTETERKIKFYDDNKKGGLGLLIEKMKLAFYKSLLNRRAEKKKIFLLKHIKNEPRIGTLAQAIIEDMLFNLSPKADVYQKGNLTEEEAIACVEALARVPQQVNKWGKPLAKIFMKDLYDIYYTKVIPGCITAYKNTSHNQYQYQNKKVGYSFIGMIKNIFRKKLYYPKDKSSLLK